MILSMLRLDIRKASAHGLGHLLAPHREDDAPASFPVPALSLQTIGVERWQYDLWYQVIVLRSASRASVTRLRAFLGFRS
jgi:hypothetical protein